MNLTVSITRRIDGKYYPVAYNTNGSIKPDTVKIKNVETHMTGGMYYINWYEGKRAVRESVGPHASVARSKKDKKEQQLKVIADGLEAGLILAAPVNEAKDSRLSLESATAGWLGETAEHKDSKTYAAYKTCAAYFLESCDKPYVTDVNRDDMLEFKTFLRQQPGRDSEFMSDRTIANKFSAIMTFLEWAKVDPKTNEYDWPGYTKKDPVVYSEATLNALYVACTPDELLLFEFFENAGMRKGEVMHAQWINLNEVAGEITVRSVKCKHCPKGVWYPKKNRERTVTLPDWLTAKLVEAHKLSTSEWIFPGDIKGLPDDHHIRTVKEVAARAGFNPDDFCIQKFRSTNATMNLRNGIDLKTVGELLGHSNPTSTQRYLTAIQGPELKAKINRTRGQRVTTA